MIIKKNAKVDNNYFTVCSFLLQYKVRFDCDVYIVYHQACGSENKKEKRGDDDDEFY